MGAIKTLILTHGHKKNAYFLSSPHNFEVIDTVAIDNAAKPGAIDESEFSRQIDGFLSKQSNGLVEFIVRCVSGMGLIDRNWRGDPMLIVVLLTGEYRPQLRLPQLLEKYFVGRRFAASKEGYRCLFAVDVSAISNEDSTALYEHGVDIVFDSSYDWNRLDHDLRERFCLVSRLWMWHTQSKWRDIAVGFFAFLFFGMTQKTAEKIADQLVQLSGGVGNFVWAVFLVICLGLSFGLAAGLTSRLKK